MFKQPLLLLVFTCLLACSTSWGHQFFFAHGEIEYNEVAQKFEGSFVATAHDLESCLMQSYGLKTKLEKLDPSATEVGILETYLNKHLTLRYGCSLDSNAVDAYCSSQWEIEGFQVLKNGTIELYFSSVAKQLYPALQIDCTFLMDAFPEQQNKVTFIYRGESQTVNFTSNKHTQQIALKP